MPNISSTSLIEKQNLPEVEVLLATFNGASYLQEFLGSLAHQEGVKIHLRVSDDGSTDRTLEIVNSFKDQFASFNIYSGPCNGPSANFFSLIENKAINYFELPSSLDQQFFDYLKGKNTHKNIII